MFAAPIVPVAVVLVLAAACFGIGTAKGSWRIWLAGYGFAVVALALAYAGALRSRHAPVPQPAPPPVTSPEIRR